MGSGTVHLSSKWRTLLACMVMLAASEFVIRGPGRALIQEHEFNDLLSPYVQTQLWIHGYDPYSPKSLLDYWPSSAAQFPFPADEVLNGSMLRNHGIPTAYPPTCFVVLAPLALMSWPISKIIWAITTAMLFVIMICALISVGELKNDKRCLYAFLIFAFLLAPFHTGIAIENIGIAATELGVIAIWTTQKKENLATSLLLVFAISLKPQIGLCFLAFYLLNRRWRIVGITTLAESAIAFIAIARMQTGGVAWLSSYKLANRTLFAAGVLSNFAPENPTRFGLINLQVVLYNLFGTRFEINFFAVGIALCLFALFLWLIPGRTRSENDFLQLSAIVVISLLPVYHRFYDASLLIVPVRYFIAGIGIRRVPSLLGLALIIPFFVPGGSLLQVLQDNGQISPVLTKAWWWSLIVMPHQIWCLLLLSVLLLYCLSRTEVSSAASSITNINETAPCALYE